MPITTDELRRAAAELSPEERRALFGGPAERHDRQQSHKWQALADAVPEGKVAEVVNACRAGIRHAHEHREDDTADGDAFRKLADVAPALANAVRARCENVSHKPLVWGLGRVAEYLQSEAHEQRRAAARRRVPAAAPAAAAEPAGKGGAK